MTITANNLYWAAGIMEGEGYFGIRKAGDIVIQLTMTDKDVVARMFSIFKIGTRKERVLPSGKTAYSLIITNQRHAVGFAMTLLSLMGERRAAKITECLENWKRRDLPKKMWLTCKHGHQLSGDNLLVVKEGKYTKRRCVECGKLRQRKYRLGKTVSNS